MTTWFTADHHFSHANIIRFCNRPFGSVEEMDRELIARWNLKVNENDTVYHLGDLTLQGTKAARAILSQLNGKINVIPGSHDRRWVSGLKDGIWSRTRYLVEVLPPLVTLILAKQTIVLCHYPMLSWDKSHYGSLHLHGHSHGTIPDSLSSDRQLPPNQSRGFRIDVGVDNWDFAPASLTEIQTAIGEGDANAKHHRETRSRT